MALNEHNLSCPEGHDVVVGPHGVYCPTCYRGYPLPEGSKDYFDYQTAHEQEQIRLDRFDK